MSKDINNYYWVTEAGFDYFASRTTRILHYPLVVRLDQSQSIFNPETFSREMKFLVFIIEMAGDWSLNGKCLFEMRGSAIDKYLVPLEEVYFKIHGRRFRGCEMKSFGSFPSLAGWHYLLDVRWWWGTYLLETLVNNADSWEFGPKST